MRIAMYSTKPYDHRFFDAVLSAQLDPSAQPDAPPQHAITFLEARLTPATARLAEGHDAVCVFVNDLVNAQAIAALAEVGIKTIALRCAGFNNVDLQAAKDHDITVVRVPAYSPHGVAEHALALMLTLNRRTHRAYNRVREGNFALDGLLGFEMRDRVVGVIGTGIIGATAARLLMGVGCKVIAYDVKPNDDLVASGVTYVSLDNLLAQSEIITLHCPLLKPTYHLMDAEAFSKMRDGAMLINTSRGGLIDTSAAIDALKSGKLGHLGIDVYEEEGDLFFDDHSSDIPQDDTFARLTTFPNVLITGHQAFFTSHALEEIATTTLANLHDLEQGQPCPNTVEP